MEKLNVGAFVSMAGGLEKMLERAEQLGVDSIMIFASSPRTFVRHIYPQNEVDAFRTSYKDKDFGSLWIHGSYLMNFGTDNPDLLKKSIDCLVDELVAADRLSVEGVIFHLGSHKGRGLDAVIDQVASALKQVIERAPKGPMIVLENSAGMGGSVGSKFTELGQIIKHVGSDRIKVCLDTQHTFAAGYPIHDTNGIKKVLAEFDNEVGLDRLVAIHANDSKVPFAGGKDRHENIGVGEIGDNGMKVMLNNPVLRKLPWLLEVPGLDGKGPDKHNVDALRKLAE